MSSIADSIKLRSGRRQSSGSAAPPNYTGHPADRTLESESDTVIVRPRVARRKTIVAKTRTNAGASRKTPSAAARTSKTNGVQKPIASKAPRKRPTRPQPATRERKAVRSPTPPNVGVEQGLKTPADDSSYLQPLKRKSADVNEESLPSKRIRLNNDESDSELSVFDQTPEPPDHLDRYIPGALLESSGQTTAAAEAEVRSLPPVPPFVPIEDEPRPLPKSFDQTITAGPEVEAAPQVSADEISPVSPMTTLPAAPNALAPPTPTTAPARRSSIVLKVPSLGSLPLFDPTPASAATSSGTARKAPIRSIKTPATPGRILSEATVEEDDDDPDDDYFDDFVASSDSPTTDVAARKRRRGISKPAPRKKPALTSGSTENTKPLRKKPSLSRAPAARGKKSSDVNDPGMDTPISASNAVQSLPTPPSSQSSQSDFLGLIDPDLLKLSQSLAHREPLESKPPPIGKPEVWAPGRQELCETLPYYKSAHSGCYANGGNIYSFMFDSVGTSREYMDQDIIIARMGGSMATDAKTGAMYQKADHDINDMQPQSVLNNMAQKNPLVIICGSQNQGSVTKMPHRYCVLGWFKPTHVWGEMTKGKKGPVKTIRYRFERLDRSNASWYSASSSPAGDNDTPASPSLEMRECQACGKACPQVYLLGWMCTNPECSEMWKLPNGQHAPYDELDYHPAFLLHRTYWEREDPPFSLNPGIPQIGQHFGDNLTYINTRGVVCPDCGRCNTRYLFTGWRCDTQGCNWKLMPEHQVVMPANLHHTPWDITSAGPSLIKATAKPAINTKVKYYHNYKVVRYTIEGVDGAVIVAKANSKVVSEPGGPDDMFREMQGVDVGLERRMLRKAVDVEVDQQKETLAKPTDEDGEPEDVPEDDADDHHKAEVGARMTAFGMNFGMPYKFIASGDSKSFEDAPAAIRAARSRLNWAQSAFVNDQAGYQDFNEELVFAYMEDQKIKYHDDGEKGLGPRIATLSLGAAATMSLRVKAKYFSHVSNTGVFTDEKPLPLPLLESSGYASGYKSKTRSAALQGSAKPSKDTHTGRLDAYAELQALRQAGDSEAFRRRSKEIPKELELRRKQADAILSFHLTHGDVVIMEGEQIQKYLEHQVEPHGNLRFALTCRTVLPNHLPPYQLPPYEVKPDEERYDGGALREDGDGEAVRW
ncbi:hypothetical protein Q7P37_011177 [Cladosporium fusiforme]